MSGLDAREGRFDMCVNQTVGENRCSNNQTVVPLIPVFLAQDYKAGLQLCHKAAWWGGHAVLRWGRASIPPALVQGV